MFDGFRQARRARKATPAATAARTTTNLLFGGGASLTYPGADETLKTLRRIWRRRMAVSLFAAACVLLDFGVRSGFWHWLLFAGFVAGGLAAIGYQVRGYFLANKAGQTEAQYRAGLGH